MHTQCSTSYHWAKALLITLVYGPLFSFAFTLTASALLNQASISSILSFSYHYFANSGVSFAFILLTTFVSYLIIGKANILKHKSSILFSTIVGIGCLSLQLAHHAMYYEFGEGMNERILHLFQGDLITIIAFLHHQYPLVWIILTLIACALLVGIAIEKLSWKTAAFTQKYTRPLIAVLGSWALLSGFKQLNQENQIANQLRNLGTDAYLATFKTIAAVNEDPKGGYKRYFVGLTSKDNATISTAVKWANGNPHAPKPSKIFSRPLPAAPFQILKQPSHVFIIQMESQDGATLFREELQPLCPNLNRYKDTGIYAPHFFEGSGSTNSSSYSIATSLPGIKSIPPNKQLTSRSYDSIFTYFKELGYHTSAHSAAKSNACRHGFMFKALGSDIFVSYADQVQESQWSNSWGIDDGLFTDLFLKWADNSSFNKNPQFVFWSNMSNHSPYSVDVIGQGFDAKLLSKKTLKLFDKGGYEPAVVAGHHWYADKEVGRLIDTLYQRHPDSLFIIVADHFSRYLNDPSDPLNEVRLPFILWGPNIIPQEAVGTYNTWYGTQSDIFPTLMGLLTPSRINELYGAPMWDQHKLIHLTSTAGDSTHIHLKASNSLINYRNNTTVYDLPKSEKLRRWEAAMKALSYQIIFIKDKWEK